MVEVSCVWPEGRYVQRLQIRNVCGCKKLMLVPAWLLLSCHLFMYATIFHFFTMSVGACVCKRVTELNFFALVDGSSSILFSSPSSFLGYSLMRMTREDSIPN